NKVATIIVINHTAVNNQKLDKLSDNDVASSYKEQTIYFIIAHSGDRCMNKPEFKQQYQTGVLQVIFMLICKSSTVSRERRKEEWLLWDCLSRCSSSRNGEED
ncbi:conserved hypothetical protein, partial [Trichinella spiralis]|uniref:hypothetical protein n=1 Tax=Trichinella spiralis TaxID=6334 RepID=UPI0001EFEDC2